MYYSYLPFVLRFQRTLTHVHILRSKYTCTLYSVSMYSSSHFIGNKANIRTLLRTETCTASVLTETCVYRDDPTFAPETIPRVSCGVGFCYSV